MEKNSNKEKNEISVQEKKLKRHNRVLTFFVIILLVIVAIFVGTVGGQYLASISMNVFEAKTKCKNKVQEKVKVISNEDKYLSGVYSYNSDDLKIKITFLEKGIMQIETQNSERSIELTEGTYTIKDNKLTYKRLFIASSINGNNYWSRDIDYASVGLRLSEEFDIDEENNTLKSSSYLSIIGSEEEVVLTLN